MIEKWIYVFIAQNQIKNILTERQKNYEINTRMNVCIGCNFFMHSCVVNILCLNQIIIKYEDLYRSW